MNASSYLVSTGARTPLGLSAASSAAAVRAAISAVREHPFLIDRLGDAIPTACDSRLAPTLAGPVRFVALAETAIREACAPLASCAASAALRVPIFLALPEFRPGFDQHDADAVREGVRRIEGLPLVASAVHVFPQGNASGFAAMAAADEAIRSGATDVCLVGGVESHFHPDTIRWLDERRQLVGSVARSGFVPGEGAGFCLLASAGALGRLGLDAPTRIVSVATGAETKLIHTTDICLGEGLTSVVRNAVRGADLGDGTLQSIYCDINGERYRSEEWGFVCLRLAAHFDDATGYGSPADCWGDMGAASASLFAVLACQAAKRGHARGSRSLLWASSAGGLRGAAILQTIAAA